MARKKTLGIDKITEKGRSFRAAAAGLPEPPACIKLRDGDLPFWQSVVAAKRPDSWNESDLILAGTLAACMADIEKLKHEIREEGDIVDSRVNPKHSLLDVLTKRSLALSRTLQVHCLATSGRSIDQIKRNQQFRKDRDAIDQADENCLIPGLH